MKNKASVIMILLAGAFWGSSCVFVSKLTSLGFTSLECTAIRIVIGTLILNAACIIKGKGVSLYPRDARSWFIAASSGIFSVLSMCIFYYNAMQKTSAAISAILLYTAPVFVMIMSLIFFGERLSAKKICAFCLAIVGCALVSGIAAGAQLSTVGILCGVASGFCYSLYGIFTAFYMKRQSDSLAFSAINFLFAAIGALCLASPVSIVQKTASLGNPIALVLLFLAFSLATSVMPYALYTKGLANIRPATASILAFSEPITAAVLGITVLGQPMDIFGAIGMALVVSAIVLLNLPSKNHR